jgi:hypothetical protein
VIHEPRKFPDERIYRRRYFCFDRHGRPTSSQR